MNYFLIFTKVDKKFDFEKFLWIFIDMMIIDKITCLLGTNQNYENSGALRSGKSRTINFC
jgi:hypothetical protein